MYIAMYIDRDGDYDIAGYFTSQENAEKYCAAYLDASYFIEEVSCLDGKKDLSKVKVAYAHDVGFSKTEEGWHCFQYGSDSELCDGNSENNEIEITDTYYYGEIIICSVILSESDWNKAKKIAKEIVSQFLNFCSNNPTEAMVKEFNSTLRETSVEI